MQQIVHAKTRERAIERYPYLLKFVPNKYKTQEVCV